MTGKRLDQHCAILLAVISLCTGGLTCFAQGDEPPSAERPMNTPSAEVATEQQNDDLAKQAGDFQPAVQLGNAGFGGFGGGGFGGGAFNGGLSMGGGLGLPESAIPGKYWTAGQSLIVAIADDKSQVFGYSDRHPCWAAHPVPKLKGAALVPVVGQDATAVMYGHICFAYSPLLGTWDQLTLPEDEGAQPVVGNGTISIHSPTKGDFVFKNEWGKWFSSEEIKSGAVARHLAERGEDLESGRSLLKAYQLKVLPAEATAKLLAQLYGGENVTIVPHVGRNLLLIGAPKQRLAEIEAVLLKLDTEEASTANPVDPSNTGMAPDSRDLKTRRPAGSESVAELRARYEDLERQIAALSAKLRESPGKGEVDRLNQLALRNLVQVAFEARQRLQQAEIAGFAQRLRSLQQSVETREKLRDQVVKRRVEELLNPGLKWDDAGTPEGTNSRTLGAGTSPTDTSSEQSLEDSALFQVTVRDKNGFARVRFQPSPHSTLEQLQVGQRVMVSQTLRPIKAGFDHTPVILEDAVLLDFWQDRRRAASNQPVTIQVRGQDVASLIEAAKLGALEVHAAPPHAVSGSPNPVSSGNTIEPEGTDELRTAESGRPVSFRLRLSKPLQSCTVKKISGPGKFVDMPANNVTIDTTSSSETVWSLSGLNGDLKKELFLILDVPEGSGKPGQASPTIPLGLTDEDVLQALAGNRVTKVIYGPLSFQDGEPYYEIVVNTRLDPEDDPVKVAEQRGPIIAAVRLQKDLVVGERSPLSSRPPKRDAPLLATALVEDPPYEPKSELEKSVAKLVLTFFQDQSRLAVPCLVLNVGDVTYAVSSGTVNLVPKDLPPAIDATHLEWAGSPAPIPAVYDSRSTKEFFLYRVRDNLKAPELTETWKVSRGDRLSTLYRDSLTTLREIPVQVTDVNSFRATYSSDRKYQGYSHYFHVDRRLPGGTLLFHEGKLAGITILGADYSEGNGAYIVPAFRLLNLLRELHTEGGPDATAPGKRPSSE